MKKTGTKKTETERGTDRERRTQRRHGLYLCLYLCLFLAMFPRLGRADSPTDTTKGLIESMRAYGAEDSSLSSQEDHRHNLHQRIEENLAIAELAEWLLGAYWQKIGTEEQKNFTALLTRYLREIGYPKAAEFLVDMRIEYSGEQVNGSEALVETIAAHPEEGQVRIDYRLRQIQGKWMIWDVLLDGVSMATNLRSQVQSVIAKKSYQELVRRMRKKLEKG